MCNTERHVMYVPIPSARLDFGACNLAAMELARQGKKPREIERERNRAREKVPLNFNLPHARGKLENSSNYPHIPSVDLPKTIPYKPLQFIC